MTNDELTPQELETLASFLAPTVPQHVDPLHFAKLLSLAMLKQEEGGPVVTDAGLEVLNGHDHITPAPSGA